MSTNRTSTHPVAVRNRTAKARRIVEFLDAKDLVMTSGVASGMNHEFWTMVNKAMGEPRETISDLTIATVIGILAGQEVQR